MESRPEEIAKLLASAHHALDHPESLESRVAVQRMRQILRLWHEPSFGAYLAWLLFDHTKLPSDPATRTLPSWMLVREASWQCPHDMGRFADPLQGLREGFDAPPTTMVRDGQIALELVRSCLYEMAQLPVPFFGVERPVGIDGEMWGIEAGQPFLRLRLEWWGDGPVEWAEFTRAVARLRGHLTDALRDSEPRA